MRKILFFLTTCLIFSCGENREKQMTTEFEDAASEDRIENILEDTIGEENKINPDAAVTFVNSWLEMLRNIDGPSDMVKWVKSNNMMTQRYQTEIATMLEEAYKKDPIAGLGADPILDAQDSPSGFERDSFDNSSKTVIVKGKDWQDYKLRIQMTLEDGKWLVDDVENISE